MTFPTYLVCSYLFMTVFTIIAFVAETIHNLSERKKIYNTLYEEWRSEKNAHITIGNDFTKSWAYERYQQRSKQFDWSNSAIFAACTLMSPLIFPLFLAGGIIIGICAAGSFVLHTIEKYWFDEISKAKK